ncbi:reverse transcriptase domain-containing protein [Tanacetum coccineum]
MTGVLRHIVEHRLNMREGCSPIRKKKRGQSADQIQAIQEEVGKLVEAGIMKEVHYHDWLSNPVMVKKHDGSWRICVNFKDLNKACPKDGYPLPEIDWKVESLCGFPFKCFLDAYKGYHQIQMAKEDEEKTAFITSVQENEAANSGASQVNRTKGKGGIHHLFGGNQRNGKRSPDDEKRSAGLDSSGAGLILTNPEGMEFTYALRFRFDATNNEVEYEALIAGLRIAEQLGVKNLQANVDSRLVANQVNGTYVAKEVDMIRYLEKVRTLASSFKAFSIRQVPRNENKKADALSKIESTSFAHLSKQVLVEELKEKSIGEVEVLAVVEEEGDTWMTPIFEYLTEETLPADVKKVRAVRRKNPQQKLTPITSPWPFYKWRIDIAGPLLEGPGKVKFLIVAIDYFTKWIEAKPVATITGNQIKKFVWENIVCRFGLPGEIISDNGKQFQDNPFKYWCEKLCIRQHFASVKHPQINGLVEKTNRSLGEGIKARLDARSKK